MEEEVKPVRWIGSSYKDLRDLPSEVRKAFGFAIDQAQRGGKHPDAKPLRGFSDAGIVEVVKDHLGDTFRGIYTVRFSGVVYVLHVFSKKSKIGISTPKHEIELIKKRLKNAEIDYNWWKLEQLRRPKNV
jgi:phage-related protein